MSKKHRDLTADEKALWRRVAAEVRTRRGASPAPEGDSSAAAPAKRRAAEPSPQTVKTAARMNPPPPANRGNEKRVRRGKLDIGAKLDLHGHTQASGRAALGRFLRAARRRGERTVIVITGVGRAGEGVLKRMLPDWLAEPDLAEFVSGFAPAHRSHGGAGAFYVFLKRSAETSA
ncbi:MAG: Smr/MutS family protein [Hyphomonadaceae bacterium]